MGVDDEDAAPDSERQVVDERIFPVLRVGSVRWCAERYDRIYWWLPLRLMFAAGWWVRAGWVKQGLPAGISTVLAFSAGALTNVFTQGWSSPVGVGLGVLVVCWVTWKSAKLRGTTRLRGRGPPQPGRLGHN